MVWPGSSKYINALDAMLNPDDEGATHVQVIAYLK
jgi:hypothetical protein